jgi:hypothetical protein
MTAILDNLKAFYESLSTAEAIVIVIVLMMITGILVLYLMYRYIRSSIEKRLRLSKRIVTYTTGKLSEKTKDNKLRQRTEETVRGVVGDNTVDSIGNALKPDDDVNINKDIYELLDELGEESLWFSVVAFFYKRIFKRKIEEREASLNNEKLLSKD